MLKKPIKTELNTTNHTIMVMCIGARFLHKLLVHVSSASDTLLKTSGVNISTNLQV